MKPLPLIQKTVTFCFAALTLLSCHSQSKSVSTLTPTVVPQTQKWSDRMAQTIIKQHPESYMIDNAKEPKWDYVHGLVLKAMEVLNDQRHNPKYATYIKSYVDNFVQEDGNLKTYQIEKYNIDMVVSGRLLFAVYDQTKDQKYLKAMQLLRRQLQEQPRTQTGGFWHKKVYPYQMWLDGLYMGEPFYAQYTKTFENGKNFDDIAKQFELIQTYAKDPKTGLLYHGWDESKQMAWANQQTGTSPNFWSRSLGWYVMALVDVLDYMPKSHPKHNALVGYLNETAAAISKFQDQSGLWYQVTDKGNQGRNYLEASGSAMFAYAFAKGANKGYLPAKYKTVAQKAFDGITRDLVKSGPQGEVIITQACAVAGLGGNPYRDGSFEYYVNERKKDNDPKATGPFILAALELDK